MKDRLLSFIRLPLYLAVLGLVVAAPLAGCSGKSAAPDSSAGAGAGAGMQGSAGSGPAGTTGGTPAAGRKRMARILASLGLSDDQKQQVRSIMSATRKENANADTETRRANMKAAYAKIETILTPEQRTKFEEKTARMRGGGNGQTAASQS